MMERAVLALIVIAAVTSRVAAQPAPAASGDSSAITAAPVNPASPPPAASSHWYGWQILLTDAAVFGVADLAHQPSFVYGWIGGGAIVHMAHGNIGRGLASAALRVALPLIGASLGAASADGCTGDWCNLGPLAVGGAIGLGAAELIDVVLLAHDRTPAAATVHAAPHDGLAVSPVVRAGRAGFGLDLVGRF